MMAYKKFLHCSDRKVKRLWYFKITNGTILFGKLIMLPAIKLQRWKSPTVYRATHRKKLIPFNFILIVWILNRLSLTRQKDGMFGKAEFRIAMTVIKQVRQKRQSRMVWLQHHLN